MIGRLRTAAKYFTVGLVVGVLFAPDAGADMRERIRTRLLGYVPGGRRGQ